MKIIGDYNKVTLFEYFSKHIFLDYKFYIESRQENEEKNKKVIIEFLNQLLKNDEKINKEVFEKIVKYFEDNDKNYIEPANSSLQILLAICFTLHLGNNKDHIKAQQLIQKALKFGDKYTHLLLNLFSYGKNVDTNGEPINSSKNDIDTKHKAETSIATVTATVTTTQEVQPIKNKIDLIDEKIKYEKNKEEEIKYKEAKNKLSHAQLGADLKTPLSYVVLGWAYMDDDLGKEKNEKLALELIEKASELNCVLAHQTLYNYYFNKLTKEKWSTKITKEARKYLEKAANAGFPEAIEIITTSYKTGESFYWKSTEKALEWERKGAAFGNLSSQFQLAMRYLNGDDVAKDKDKAIHFLSNVAAYSHPTALFVLATIFIGDILICAEIKNSLLLNSNIFSHKPETIKYDYEHFITPYTKQGLECLETAKKLGHKTSQIALGQLYFSGLLVEQDFRRGFQLIDEALASPLENNFDMNDVDNKNLIISMKSFLALCYFLGLGVEKNPIMALNHFQESININPNDPHIYYSAAIFFIRYYNQELYPVACFQYRDFSAEGTKLISEAYQMLSLSQAHLIQAEKLQYPLAMTRLAKYTLRQQYVDVRNAIISNIINNPINANVNFVRTPMERLNDANEKGSLEAKYWLAHLKSGNNLDPLMEKNFKLEVNTRVEVNKEEAEKYFKELNEIAKIGNYQALHLVGRCYEGGYGCPQHIDTALKYYKDNADKGVLVSERRMQKLKENMQPIYDTILTALLEYGMASAPAVSQIVTYYAMDIDFTPLYKSISNAITHHRIPFTTDINKIIRNLAM